MHATLAMNSRDVLILGGMLATIIGGCALIVWARLWPVRVGLVASGLAMGVGLAYFGYMPFGGGGHPPDVYFGCTMLCMGFLSGCILTALEAVSHPQPEEPRGFPVEPDADGVIRLADSPRDSGRDPK